MDLEMDTARQVLEGAVREGVRCPRTGQPLDAATSVLARIVYRSGTVADVVVHASVWHNVEAQLPYLRKMSAVSHVTVFDGRELFAASNAGDAKVS